MGEVILIEGLKTRTVERLSRDRIPMYVAPTQLAPIRHSDDLAYDPCGTIDEVTMPIIELFQYHRDSATRSETLIAISPEVEKLLQVPVNTIWKELGECRKENGRLHVELMYFKSIGFWKRLRFLFKGAT